MTQKCPSFDEILSASAVHMIPVLFALGKLFEKSTAYVVCISNKKNPTIAEVNIFLVILNGSSGMYIS